MDIKNINGDYIKIGKTSITVKKEDIPKTKGVITNCTIMTEAGVNVIKCRILK